MRKTPRWYVYIMTNRPRSHVLYTGFTGNLVLRVYQHKNKLLKGFTSRYNLTRLVYYEEWFQPAAGIRREKEIKGWLRVKKIRVIESINPKWKDLAEHWYDDVGKPINLAPQPTEKDAARTTLKPASSRGALAPKSLPRAQSRGPRA